MSPGRYSARMLWFKVAVSSTLLNAVMCSSVSQPVHGAVLHGPAYSRRENGVLDEEVGADAGHPPRSFGNDLSHDAPYTAQRFKFGYKIIDKYGNKQTREEEADEYNNRKGYYSFIDHDGKHRKVEYVADSHGFRATVVTNEPGTAHSHPAETEIIADSASRVAFAHDGERSIDSRTKLPSTSGISVVLPQAASVTPIRALAHQASIAHIAHTGSSIAVQMPLGTSPSTLVPAYHPRPVEQVVHSDLKHRPHPGSSGHEAPAFTV